MPITPSFLTLETCKRTSVSRPTGLKHALSHHPGAIDFLGHSEPTLRVAGLVAAQEQQLAAFPNERPLRWQKAPSWWRLLQSKMELLLWHPKKPPAPKAGLARNLIIRRTNEAFHYLIATAQSCLHQEISPSWDNLVGWQAGRPWAHKGKKENIAE